MAGQEEWAGNRTTIVLHGSELAKSCGELIVLVMTQQTAVAQDAAFWPLIEKVHTGKQVYDHLKSMAKVHVDTASANGKAVDALQAEASDAVVKA